MSSHEAAATTGTTAGMLFSLIALSTACASQVNALVPRWRAPEQITSAAVWVSVAASGALLLSVFTGAASALVGVMQFLWGTVASAPVSVFHDPSGRLMGVVIGLLSLGAVVACLFGRSVGPAVAETP